MRDDALPINEGAWRSDGSAAIVGWIRSPRMQDTKRKAYEKPTLHRQGTLSRVTAGANSGNQ
jgi:hypothetical protein